MKESTKNRLKKVGKVSLYCLGLGFALLSGLVVGKCSADNANRSSSGESSSLSPTHHVLHHEGESVARSDSPSLPVKRANEEAFDYAPYFESFDNVNVVSAFIQSNTGFSFHCVDLYNHPDFRGRFICVLDGATGFNRGWCDYQIRQLLREGYRGNLTDGTDILSYPSGGYVADDFKFVIDTAGASEWDCCAFRLWKGVTTFHVYTEADYYRYFYETETSIDMGEYYNPLPMIGQTINDASIIVYPAAGSSVNVNPVTFLRSGSNDFVFVSSGQVFDGFRIELSRVMNVQGSQVERYATRNGETIIAPDMSLNYVTANAFYYRLLDTQQWVKVWELPYNGTDKGYNYWSYNGRWLSSSFRYIEVKVDGGATGLSSWLPTFTLTDLLALNVWTAGALVLGDSYNNVFTMLGKGFESVGGILTIQILPYLSLGTLIFVPLIVLIIFAILRILNK